MKKTKTLLALALTAAMIISIIPAGAKAAKAPKLSKTKISVEVGSTTTVKVKNSAAKAKVTWKIANTKIAKISKKVAKGKKASAAVLGVSAGSTKLTAKYKLGKNTKKLSCKITVTEKAAAPAADNNSTANNHAQTPAQNNQQTLSQDNNNPSNPVTEPTAAPTDVPEATAYPRPISVALTTDVPAAYRETAQDAPRDKQGTVVSITYETETYDNLSGGPASVKMTKGANVYLPAGYDENEKYNVFYLMHGGGENKDTWLVENDFSGNKKMLDNLIASGEIEPLIVVTPTFYRPNGVSDNGMDLTDQFKYELRKDLIPYIESHYSTYAEGDVSEENLIKTRLHRAFAGLSMGSMTTYRAALYGNYDVIGWFGPYSGCQGPGGDHDAEARKIISVIKDGLDKGMPLGFLYCGNGVSDMAHDEHLDIMKKAAAMDDVLVENANYAFIDLPVLDRSYGGKTGEHSMWSWHIHFYNSLRVFFSWE